jgi:hypothetical protein
MRDFKGMKRSRSRNRRSGGSQQGQNNNPNRSFDSSGPEGIKVRGNAQTVYERYQQLARDATTSGDRILAENYLQHAEHYFRLLRIMQPNRPVSEIAAREGANAGFDIDFEDESGTQFSQTPQPAQPEPAENLPAQPQEAEAPAGDRSGGDRPEGEGQGGRRETRRERYERRRQERWSTDGRDDQAEGGEQAASDPLAVIEPAAERADPDDAHMPSFLTRPVPAPTPAETSDEEEAPAPRRRTRARKPAADAAPDGES